MKTDDIHNIYIHITGRAEGIVLAGGKADLPIMFAEALREYLHKEWVGLTGTEINHIFAANAGYPERMMQEVAKLLKEKNNVVSR
jgi:hypothetical protein